MNKKRSRGNGEGSIFKRKVRGKEKWVCEYTLGYTEDGKRKAKTIYGDSRTEVKNKLESLITDLRTDKFVDKSTITLHSICKSLIEYEYQTNRLCDSSYIRKMETLKQIDNHYISKMEIQKIKDYDIKDFLIYITKYSKSTISKIYGLANNGFKKAMKDNIIKRNYLDDKFEYGVPNSSKTTRKVRAFTLEEQKRFLDVLNSNDVKHIPYKYQYLLSMFTGMRMGEINALSLNDVDLENSIIHINHTITRSLKKGVKRGERTKTYNSMRDIIIDPQVSTILKDYISNYYKANKEHILFYDLKNDTYITTNEVNCSFKRLCKKYKITDIQTNQHLLRHTFATRCIEADIPAHILQKILGHKSINITLDTYCDMFAQYQTKHTHNALDYLTQNGLTVQ